MARKSKPSDYTPPKKRVQQIFYDNEKYQRTMKLVKQYAIGYCIDQMKLEHGGVLERWRVGTTIVVVLCERNLGSPAHVEGNEFQVQVLAPIEKGIMWDDLEKALAKLAGVNGPQKEE